MSDFYLCDICRRKVRDEGGTVTLCPRILARGGVKVPMVDHHGMGGRRYDDPGDVCQGFEQSEGV